MHQAKLPVYGIRNKFSAWHYPTSAVCILTVGAYGIWYNIPYHIKWYMLICFMTPAHMFVNIFRTCMCTTLHNAICHIHVLNVYMSRVMRKPDFCLGENKGADQLRGNREADQRLCFRYTDSTISLLLKSEISSF